MNWSHNYTAEAAATTAAKHNQKKNILAEFIIKMRSHNIFNLRPYEMNNYCIMVRPGRINVVCFKVTAWVI